jgi:hypothetical protein
MFTLSQADRQTVFNQLATNPNPTDEQITQMADDLYQARVEAAIRALVQELASQAAFSRRTYEMRFYPLLAPLPKDAKPIEVGRSEDTVIVEQPQRQPYKVRLVDLADFCREHKLDLKAMTEVGEGTRKEHRGWTRLPWTGNPHEAGQTYREPTPVQPKPAKQVVKRMRAGGPSALRPITYTPAN